MKKLIAVVSLVFFLSPLMALAALYKSSDGKVWADWNGKRRWIRTLEIFSSYGYKWSDVKDIADLSLSKKPINNLVRVKDKLEVYALSDNGYKRHIHNPDIFNSYNLSWDDVADINETELAGYSDCNLIKETDNEKVYKLDGNNLYPIKDLATFNYYGFNWSTLQIINSEDLATYTIGSELTYTAPAGSPSPSPVWSPIPSSSPSSTPTPTPTPNSSSEALEITSIIVSSTLTTMHFEWSTNKLTTSKVFISGGSNLSKVYVSESGVSTRHIANITGLSSNTNYSYEIESVAGVEVAKKQGSYTTNLDELVLSVQADKTSVQLTNWNSVRVTAQFTKNGNLVPVDITFSAPDSSKTFKVIQGSSGGCGSNNPFLIQLAGATGGSCSSDAKVTFDYLPKSLGTHTITVSASGVIKTINVEITPYVKIDPVISDIVNSNSVFEINSMEEKSIGSFKFTQADESISFDTYNYTYESDVQNKGFLRIVSSGAAYQLRVTPKTNAYALAPGVHTVKVTEIKVVGMSSGNYRYVSGLPITFTFEIKDIPQAEIIPIKTTYTFNLPTAGSGSSLPPGPGIIGSFKIKLNYNSSIKIVSYNIRFEDNHPKIIGISGYQVDAFIGRLYKEGLQDAKTEINTGSDGISVASYVLWVGYAGTSAPEQFYKVPTGKIKFFLENLNVVDQRTGITRTIQGPLIFEMELVRQ